MILRTSIIALSLLSLSAVSADAATRHRHVRGPVVVAPYEDAAPAYGYVEPGYTYGYTSHYDYPYGAWGSRAQGPFWDRCTTDEGYGRRLPCDYSGK